MVTESAEQQHENESRLEAAKLEADELKNQLADYQQALQVLQTCAIQYQQALQVLDMDIFKELDMKRTNTC